MLTAAYWLSTCHLCPARIVRFAGVSPSLPSINQYIADTGSAACDVRENSLHLMQVVFSSDLSKIVRESHERGVEVEAEGVRERKWSER